MLDSLLGPPPSYASASQPAPAVVPQVVPVRTPTKPRSQVGKWLASLGLEQYETAFDAAGYASLNELSPVTEVS